MSWRQFYFWGDQRYALIGSGGGTTWGAITGTLSSQTDLQTALDAKVDIAGDTMTGDLEVPDEVYGVSWNGSTEVPTKNALYDKIETLGSATWGGITGTLSDQTDLQTELDAKANLAGDTFTGDQTITLTGDVSGSGTGSFAATVERIQGVDVESGTPSDAHVLTYNASAAAWEGQAAAAGSGTVTSVSAGVGLTASTNPITSAGSIQLADTAVSAGTYLLPQITIDGQGRITSSVSAQASAARAQIGSVIGTDVQAFDADTAKTDVEQEFTEPQYGGVSTLTDAATISWDMSGNKNDVQVTLGGNRTLAEPTNHNFGQKGVIRFIQDGTGSRTVTFNAAYKFPGGTAPTLTTTASAVDRVYYHCIASGRIECTSQLNFT